MQKRTRKFLGAVAMLAFVIVYALVAMTQARPTQEAPVLLQTLIYAVLGLAWILPLMPLIRWMEWGRG
jgi:hypothetical protein